MAKNIFILVCVLTVALLPVAVIASYSEEPVDIPGEETLLSMIDLAQEIEYSVAAGQFQWFKAGKNYNDINKTGYFDESTAAIRYGEVEEGREYDDVVEMIKDLFSDELAKRLLDSKQMEGFRSKYTKNSGRSYHGYIITQIGLDTYCNSRVKDAPAEIALPDNDTCRVTLTTLSYGDGFSEGDYYRSPEEKKTYVDLVLQNGLWKISGGTYFTELDGLTPHNASTGDSRSLYGFAAVFIAGTVIIGRRRDLRRSRSFRPESRQTRAA